MSRTESINSPILTYEHPDYENRVDLVGTVHIAEPTYYEALQEFVDGRTDEGAIVHYELSKKPTADQLAAAPHSARRKVERTLSAMGELYAMLGGVEGLVSQNKGLIYREAWQNHDTTLLDQATTMSRLTVDGLWVGAQAMKLASRILGPDEMQVIMLQQLNAATSDKEHKPSITERLLTIGREKHVVEGRNTIAMAAFDAELDTDPAPDVLLLWGANHLKGLGREVLKRGFVQTDERYLTAIHAR